MKWHTALLIHSWQAVHRLKRLHGVEHPRLVVFCVTPAAPRMYVLDSSMQSYEWLDGLLGGYPKLLHVFFVVGHSLFTSSTLLPPSFFSFLVQNASKMRFSSELHSFAFLAFTFFGASFTTAARLQPRLDDGSAVTTSTKSKCGGKPTGGAAAATISLPNAGALSTGLPSGSGGLMGPNATSLSSSLPYTRTKKCTKTNTRYITSPSSGAAGSGDQGGASQGSQRLLPLTC